MTRDDLIKVASARFRNGLPLGEALLFIRQNGGDKSVCYQMLRQEKPNLSWLIRHDLVHFSPVWEDRKEIDEQCEAGFFKAVEEFAWEAKV